MRIAVTTVATEEKIKQDSFLKKKEMFTSDTFLNVKQSCIFVIRVVFKEQLKDLVTANTKNTFLNEYDSALQININQIIVLCTFR